MSDRWIEWRKLVETMSLVYFKDGINIKSWVLLAFQAMGVNLKKLIKIKWVERFFGLTYFSAIKKTAQHLFSFSKISTTGVD